LVILLRLLIQATFANAVCFCAVSYLQGPPPVDNELKFLYSGSSTSKRKRTVTATDGLMTYEGHNLSLEPPPYR
jgi:hypothetical protein